MVDAPETIWIFDLWEQRGQGYADWTEAYKESIWDDGVGVQYTRTDIADNTLHTSNRLLIEAQDNSEAEIARLKSELDTALRLLRDNKGLMHWDRELTTADSDVLRKSRGLS